MIPYLMTVDDVQAWQVAPDGTIPDGARTMVEVYHGEWSRARRAWVWYSDINHCYAVAAAGDWIVAHDYGLEVFTDDYFRKVCKRVDQRTIVPITDAMVDAFAPAYMAIASKVEARGKETGSRFRNAVRAGLAAALAVEEWSGK